jgi:hypothetical protein
MPDANVAILKGLGTARTLGIATITPMLNLLVNGSGGCSLMALIDRYRCRLEGTDQDWLLRSSASFADES